MWIYTQESKFGQKLGRYLSLLLYHLFYLDLIDVFYGEMCFYTITTVLGSLVFDVFKDVSRVTIFTTR
jgi:hypothetical protein